MAEGFQNFFCEKISRIEGDFPLPSQGYEFGELERRGRFMNCPFPKVTMFCHILRKRKSLASETMFMKCVIIEIANPGKMKLPILRLLVSFDLSRSKHTLHGDHQLLFLVCHIWMVSI